MPTRASLTSSAASTRSAETAQTMQRIERDEPGRARDVGSPSLSDSLPSQEPTSTPGVPSPATPNPASKPSKWPPNIWDQRHIAGSRAVNSIETASRERALCVVSCSWGLGRQIQLLNQSSRRRFFPVAGFRSPGFLSAVADGLHRNATLQRMKESLLAAEESVLTHPELRMTTKSFDQVIVYIPEVEDRNIPIR